MIKLEDYRKDKQFKIDSLSFQEIFESLKSGIEKTICDFEQIEELEDLFYPNLDSRTEMKYGKDKDVYPSVIFMIAAKTGKRWGNTYYYCVLNPFEIELCCSGKEDTITSEELTQALINMMNEKFPNSDYMEKREKYFKMAELMQRKREELLFF